MDFVIIANAWTAGLDNPTSKHQIALELARQGHRVLWMEGAGMRRPSLSSGADRGRIVRKLAAALRGPNEVFGVQGSEFRGEQGKGCGTGGGQISNSQFSMSNVQGEEGGRLDDLGLIDSGGDETARMLDQGPPLQNLESRISPSVPPTTRPSQFALHSAAPQGAIWVLTPLLIPLPGRAWVRRFNGRLYATLARRWCRRLGFVDPVLINYVPVLADAMRGWGGGESKVEGRRSRVEAKGGGRRSEVREQRTEDGGVRVVYHCVDRWDQFDMYDSALMGEMDRHCCEFADLVIATSRDLYDHCLALNANTHLVNHGVNYEHFARGLPRGNVPRPADLPEGRVVGFFGLLSEWVDQALLVHLARRLPASCLVLIGTPDVAIDALKQEPNIHVLGPRPFARLPDYVAWFDVGIIPFVVNELTRAVNPIKLREMLAAGCPIVSTALPEVCQYVGDGDDGSDGGVTVAQTREEFEAGVRDRLERPLTEDERSRISRTMGAETWAAKVRQIVALVEPASTRS